MFVLKKSGKNKFHHKLTEKVSENHDENDFFKDTEGVRF